MIDTFISMFPYVRGPVFWGATCETLYMTAIAGVATCVLGLILGIVLFLTSPGQMLQNRPIYWAISAVVNVFRSIPFIILIVLLIPFTKKVVGTILGADAALPALVVGAAPFYARLVEIALKEVDRGVIEAARAMGASLHTIILRVLLPESSPALVSGMTVTSIALVGFTAMAGVVGAGGLGNLAYQEGFQRSHNDVTVCATLVILVIVFVLQLVGDRLTRWLDKR